MKDSDYEVRLAELQALGGDVTKKFDSVYEIDLEILKQIEEGAGPDIQDVDVLPEAASHSGEFYRLNSSKKVYVATYNSSNEWVWAEIGTGGEIVPMVAGENITINGNVINASVENVINDASVLSNRTWSSEKINSELEALAGDANSEIVAAETIDVTFVNAVPTEAGTEGQYVIYTTEAEDTLYKYENGAWTAQTADANKLYFDTENDQLYSYVSATHKFMPVAVDNTIIFSGSITSNAAKTALNPIKTPGVYNVLQHQTTSGKTKMTNWVMTVTYLDSDEADEAEGSVYQKLENNYTVYKRYYKPTTDTWTTMTKYYEGLVRDSLTSSAYYTWSVNKIKSSITVATETATNEEISWIFQPLEIIE